MSAGPSIRLARNTVAAIVVAATALAANADDNTLLIQHQPDGSFRVWHIEGETELTDLELQTLEASASPEGGEPMQTAAGLARAIDTGDGIVRIEIPGAPRDKALLIDRDACGGVRAWHAAGQTLLTDGQLTDLVVAAAPGGGKTFMLGDRRAKAFTTRLGVIAVMWKPVERRR